MKKILFLMFVLIILSVSACKQAVKKVEAPKVEATGDATVDSIGKDISSIDNIEKDLSVDELKDLDSGLSEVQNI